MNRSLQIPNILYFHIIGLLCCLTVIGCQQDDSNLNEQPSELESKVDTLTLEEDTATLELPAENPEPRRHAYFDPFVKLISGRGDSVPGVSFENEYLKYYQEEMKKGMKKLNRKRLLPLKQWYSSVLEEHGRNDSLVAFYPFSGGDFLHLHNVYPNSSYYLMLAIEPVGSVPRFTKATKDSLPGYLKSLRYTLRDVWNHSYFITKHMQEDLKEDPNIDGMFMSILWGLGATGHDIADVKRAKLDSTGTLVISAIDSIHKEMFDEGVEVTFFHPSNCNLKSVVYLRCNIADKGINKSAKLDTFLTNLPPVNTFIKAASYLPHYSSFSKIRAAILNSSVNLLQDDTGVPFAELEADSMRVFLYGKYVLPLKVFGPGVFQQDMKRKYADTNYFKGDLPFSMGYHAHTKSQSQIVAMKNYKGSQIVVEQLAKKDELREENQATSELEEDAEELAFEEPKEEETKQPEAKSKSEITPNVEQIKLEKKTPTSPKNENPQEPKRETPATEEESVPDVVYRIQIAATSKRKSSNSSVFKGLPIWTYEEGGLYKHTTGSFSTEGAAIRRRDEVRELGFLDAFVIKFENEKRVQ